MIVDHQIIVAVNVVVAALFIPLLVIGTLLTMARALRTKREHRAIPIVLKRDLVSRTFLTIPIAGIVLVRALGINGLADNIVWVVTTGAMFVISVGTYAFFEVFVIESPRYYERLHSDTAQGDRIEAAIAANTVVSQEASDHADKAYHEANTVNQKLEAQGREILEGREAK